MVTKTQSLQEILTKYPNLKDVFEVNGFKGLNNESIIKQLGKSTVEELLKNKGLGVDLFINMLNEHINSEEIDITLVEQSNSEKSIRIIGLLPCPVRIPLMEQFATLSNVDDINHNLKAASEGLDWLKEEVKDSEEKDLADIYISAGFDLFFEDDLMKKFFLVVFILPLLTQGCGTFNTDPNQYASTPESTLCINYYRDLMRHNIHAKPKRIMEKL